MYIPKHFAITDQEEIFAFIEANAFGQLVSSLAGRPFATAMPFLIDAQRTKLIGHLAGQNPQHAELAGQEVLISLLGPHEYISPSWYASPGVPTWNYQAVHIYGRCSVFSDAERLRSLVDSLTRKYESGFASPWSPDYPAAMLKAIVGVEVTIGEIQCKYKLSQNRSPDDRRQVHERLAAGGANALAEAMRRNER